MLKPRFVSLHNHSEHSSLDGLTKVASYVTASKSDGASAVALTDHGTAAGWFTLREACRAAELKPIYGIESYIAAQGSRFNPQPRPWKTGGSPAHRREHVTLLARTSQGARNLLRIHNASIYSLVGGKPTIDLNLLRHCWQCCTEPPSENQPVVPRSVCGHDSGFIILTGCLNGRVAGPLAADRQDIARHGLEDYIDTVGKDNVYVEVMYHQIAEEKKVITKLRDLAAEYGLDLIATNDCHYLHESDSQTHDAWLCFQTKAKLSDASSDEEGAVGRFSFNGSGYHYRTDAQMRGVAETGNVPKALARQSWWHQAIDNTAKLADRVEDDVWDLDEHLKLPRFPIPNDCAECLALTEVTQPTATTHLRHLVIAGLKAKYPTPLSPQVVERAKRELQVIDQMGFSDYFLLVNDVYEYMRAEGIGYGLGGRGSVGGSLASYALGLSGVDPLKHELLFERFLDQTRTDKMPDIDCLSGDMVLSKDGPGNHRIDYLYALLSGSPHWDGNLQQCRACLSENYTTIYPKSGLCTPCWKALNRLKNRFASKGHLFTVAGLLDNDRIGRVPVLDILYKGKRDVVTLHLDTIDKHITSTYNHRHKTSSAWKAASDFVLGEQIVTTRINPRKNALDHRDPKFARLKERANGACEICSTATARSYEVAHKTYIKTRQKQQWAWRLEDLLYLCTKCHRNYDRKYGSESESSPITRITYESQVDVYDVVIDSNQHAFIANGILTHNCDVASDRRDEVYAYLAQKYGIDHVARIGAPQYAKSRNALARAGQVLGLADAAWPLRKTIPMDGVEPLTFPEIEQRAADGDVACVEFMELAKSTPEHRQVYEQAKGFAGTLSGQSLHAAGIVIADAPLPGAIPLRKRAGDAASEPPITEMVMDEIEHCGYLKADFLGLVNLSVMATAVANIRRETGEQIDLYNLPDPDATNLVGIEAQRVAKSWRLLQRGDVAGVFQFEESASAATALMSLKPDSLADIAVANAAIRPGPGADAARIYADVKLGRAKISYERFTHNLDEIAVLDSVLRVTNGLCMYQEQSMRLGRELAGFGPALVSKLRAAISKKKDSMWDELEPLWLAGAQRAVNDAGDPKQAFSAQTARAVWAELRQSSRYQFNQSHAYGYGYTAWVCAYLKANWPAAYGAAYLHHSEDNSKRLRAINELRKSGLEILPPSVNHSDLSTTGQAGTVRLGLTEIKGFGANMARIVANQPYTSLGDLMTRAKVTPTLLRKLAAAGALDDFGSRLGITMISDVATTVSDIPSAEWTAGEKEVRQTGLIGFVTGEHPLVKYRTGIVRWIDTHPNPRGELAGFLTDLILAPGAPAHVVALLADVQVKTYSQGQFAALTLNDELGNQVEALLWNDELRRIGGADNLPEPGATVRVWGRMGRDGSSINARTVEQTNFGTREF